MKKIIIIFLLLLISINLGFCANLTIESNTQEVDMENNKINLLGKVKLILDNFTLFSPRAVGEIDPKTNKLKNATFYDMPYGIQIDGEKKNEVKAQIIKASLLNKTVQAQGNAQSVMSENNQPFLIVTSNIQEYDTKCERMKAFENVVVNYQDVETFSNQAIVDVVRKKGEVKKIQLIGNAKIIQKENVSTADKFVYTSSNEEIIGIGNTYSNAVLNDNEKIQVWAQYQQYNKRANTMIASNSVKVIYGDYTAYGPKVSVFPDPKTNKFNKVIFLGRSKIIEKGRMVEADKIVLTLNPRNFFAQGNVKTTIPNVDSLENEQ